METTMKLKTTALVASLLCSSMAYATETALGALHINHTDPTTGFKVEFEASETLEDAVRIRYQFRYIDSSGTVIASCIGPIGNHDQSRPDLLPGEDLVFTGSTASVGRSDLTPFLFDRTVCDDGLVFPSSVIVECRSDGQIGQIVTNSSGSRKVLIRKNPNTYAVSSFLTAGKSGTCTFTIDGEVAVVRGMIERRVEKTP
jgi:hypothetical protein